MGRFPEAGGPLDSDGVPGVVSGGGARCEGGSHGLGGHGVRESWVWGGAGGMGRGGAKGMGHLSAAGVPLATHWVVCEVRWRVGREW